MKKIFSFAENVQLKSEPPHPLVHPPLENARAIRMVRVLAGSGSAPIKCVLETASLDSDPEYLALSYRWGDPSNKTWITVNSQRYDITRDLLAALKRFRRKSDSVVFWIDQICINQEDLEERAAQVGLMKEIYSQAKRVYIWLGKESEDSHRAFKVAHWLVEVDRKYEQLQKDDSTYWQQNMLVQYMCRHPKDWRALTALIQRPWFSRVWVIQEVSAAKEATLVCGQDEVLWSDFAQGVYVLLLLALKLSGDMPIHHWRLKNLFEMSSEFLNKRHIPVEGLLQQTRIFEAAVAHDNIFATLGLCPQDKIVTVDYTRDITDLFVDVAKELLFDENKENVVGILCRSQGHGSLSLPSWVPDWTRPSHEDFLCQERCYAEFKAGGEGRLRAWKTEDKRKIRVRGKIFDSVNVASSTAPSPGPTELEVAFSRGQRPGSYYVDCSQERYLLNHWINETSAIAWRYSCYTNENSRTDAYSRTLVCDNIEPSSNFQGPERGGLEYDYWAFRTYLGTLFPGGVPTTAPPSFIKQAVEPITKGFETFKYMFQALGLNRKFFVTAGGYMALGNAEVQPGDLLCVLEGGPTPWVLRRDNDEYLMIGECYVHHAMNGEVMETEAVKVQDIILK